tara:strand:+ start:1027 stop:1395 length:369 start_codon:yes stop_codon:yes gene_type:complete
MTDISKKRYYIYENITKIKNHNHLIDYLKINKCKHTENKNGIFVNLNTINDDIINNLYSMVYESINNFIDYDYTNDFYNYELNNNIEYESEIIKEYINTNDVFFDNYSEDEKKIIEYSKTYF